MHVWMYIKLCVKPCKRRCCLTDGAKETKEIKKNDKSIKSVVKYKEYIINHAVVDYFPMSTVILIYIHLYTPRVKQT